ncbi:uncharacterized protein N7483_011590 [Penicillium malachiteum]|uniref:uncharacterized protein n=1 Tax=Penicillium malachiteum TaxID=1324776 RepID=UPI0025470F62|nr:uncharacterized protein N7483_011590 [Penicillium malachiteum]KAJ5714409.1 hypothetical protein N7483_011590 [Penicillium malachiteum]
MTILVLCARGKTGSRLCSLLEAANISFLAAMRSPSVSSNYPNCHFDWMDSTTYENPFCVFSDLEMTAISAVYLIHPPSTDAIGSHLNNFIDVARSNGVKRFVLLSASNIEKGGPAMGKAHEHLACSREIEYVVLRPTWFMQNFSEGEHLQSIRDDNTIITAAGEGKIPFVSVEDIARVAFHALTDEKVHSDEYHIGGPELLSYDQVSELQFFFKPDIPEPIPGGTTLKLTVKDREYPHKSPRPENLSLKPRWEGICPASHS